MKRSTGHCAVVAKKRVVLAIGIAFLGLVGTARATTIDDLLLQGWYGNPAGVNQAALVIDFWPGNGASDSFAFGVTFGSTAADTMTGLELLQAVQNGNSNFGFHFITDPTYGAMIDQIWYTDPETAQSYDVFANYPDAWWSYWGNDNGTWNESWVGASSRTLQNGGMDGWLAKPGDDYYSGPVAPVPEPAVLALMIAGSLAALAWHWRRRKN